MNFWQDLPRPFFVLAPMADVTDAAFRYIITKYGKPDVLWTEFVSADGLYHTRELQRLPDSENPLMKDLVYGEGERPIVAQIFSSKPAMIEYASALVTELGFDGVDINMGCPDRSIEKQKAGAALMKDSALARELIRAAKRGTQGKIPVSVNTRVGYNKVELDTWLPELLAEEPATITVHARTRKEMSDVPARWEHVRDAVDLRNRQDVGTLIIGNGDVMTLEEGRQRIEESGADGVMIGRGIFGNPWLFAGLSACRGEDRAQRPHPNPPLKEGREVVPLPLPEGEVGRGWEQNPTTPEKLRVLTEHCHAFEELCGHKSFSVMKKHFKAYVRNFDGAAELRVRLMECNSAEEVETVITKFKM
jgi:tRNA-dihydrouridine synthase